ncbi:placenta-specific protein 1 isoform X2 [Talpa occidentalis]|uniref:placenta-specific protein 1 isoform X2 n=1 Tax=Talpa occidentalis TaxID=50954 RepID=UPI0023F74615|nr:placenta-specific protein 1 isoform X2 [Talpa occidentalis]
MEPEGDLEEAHGAERHVKKLCLPFDRGLGDTDVAAFTSEHKATFQRRLTNYPSCQKELGKIEAQDQGVSRTWLCFWYFLPIFDIL